MAVYPVSDCAAIPVRLVGRDKRVSGGYDFVEALLSAGE